MWRNFISKSNLTFKITFFLCFQNLSKIIGINITSTLKTDQNYTQLCVSIIKTNIKASFLKIFLKNSNPWHCIKNMKSFSWKSSYNILSVIAYSEWFTRSISLINTHLVSIMIPSNDRFIVWTSKEDVSISIILDLFDRSWVTIKSKLSHFSQILIHFQY